MSSFKERLAKSLRVDEEVIKDNNIRYYHTKYPEWGLHYHLEPLFSNIEPFDYAASLSEHPYYSTRKSLVNSAKTYNGKVIKNYFPTKKPELSNKKDIIIMEYLKCRTNVVLISLWTSKISDKVMDYLEKNGKIYAIKKITLSDKAAKGLVYQLYADTDRYKSIDTIDSKVYEICGWEHGKDKTFNVIAYDTEMRNTRLQNGINQLLAHQGSTESKEPQKLKEYCYVNQHFYQTVDNAGIYFNNNSLRFLEEQMLENHISVRMRRSRILLSTFKIWSDRNISPLDKERFLLESGAILYSYGLRNCTDIDLYIDNEDNNLYQNKEIMEDLIDSESKFFFIDGCAKYTSTWRPYMENWHQTWASKIGAVDFHNIVYDNTYHYYFMGMKMLTLDGDIERRLVRNRPRSIADLIQINECLGKNVKIPRIPTSQLKYVRFGTIQELEEFDTSKLNNPTIKQDMLEIEYRDNIDKQIFMRSIQITLKSRYGVELEINGIQKMMGIKKIKIKR